MIKYEVAIYMKSGDVRRFHLFAHTANELLSNIALMAEKYCYVITELHITRVEKGDN